MKIRTEGRAVDRSIGQMFRFCYFCSTVKVSYYWIYPIAPAIVGLGLFRFFWVIRECCLYYRMKKFYNNVLKINEEKIKNCTWRYVLKKVVQVKQDVDELEIYQRILRFQNYAIAMVNKDLIDFKCCCKS